MAPIVVPFARLGLSFKVKIGITVPERLIHNKPQINNEQNTCTDNTNTTMSGLSSSDTHEVNQLNLLGVSYQPLILFVVLRKPALGIPR